MLSGLLARICGGPTLTGAVSRTVNRYRPGASRAGREVTTVAARPRAPCTRAATVVEWPGSFSSRAYTLQSMSQVTATAAVPVATRGQPREARPCARGVSSSSGQRGDHAAVRVADRGAHRLQARLRRVVRVVETRLEAVERRLVEGVEEQDPDHGRLAEGERRSPAGSTTPGSTPAPAWSSPARRPCRATPSRPGSAPRSRTRRRGSAASSRAAPVPSNALRRAGRSASRSRRSRSASTSGG